MPLQNRVDPFSDLFATSARGLFFGNRGGRFHRDDRTIGLRRWVSRAWICCRLEFKGRHRNVWGAGYTELFFLDEPTALAAGHRPCFECRRKDAQAFAAAFAAGTGRGAVALATPDLIRGSGQRGNSIVRAHSASEDKRAETASAREDGRLRPDVFAGWCCERADDTRPELGSSARIPRAPDIDRVLHAERLMGRDKRRHQLAIDDLPDGAFLNLADEPGVAFAIRGSSLLQWTPFGYTGRHRRPHGMVADVLTPPGIIAALSNGYRPRWHPSADG